MGLEMKIRYVLRHNNYTRTPRKLANALGAQTRIWPNNLAFRPNFQTDFMMKYPKLEDMETPPILAEYANICHQFFSLNKYQQRKMLNIWGIQTPWTCGEKNTPLMTAATGSRFVVRPMRHSQGLDYRVTEDPNDFIEGREYISQLIEKEREYRIVFIYGEPLIFLRKKVPEGTSNSMPWNHSVGGFFQTINDVSGSRIMKTNALEDLRRSPVIQSGHIVAVDILYTKKSYHVLEFNSSPALEIEDNLSKVVDFIRGR